MDTINSFSEAVKAKLDSSSSYNSLESYETEAKERVKREIENQVRYELSSSTSA